MDDILRSQSSELHALHAGAIFAYVPWRALPALAPPEPTALTLSPALLHSLVVCASTLFCTLCLGVPLAALLWYCNALLSTTRTPAPSTPPQGLKALRVPPCSPGCVMELPDAIESRIDWERAKELMAAKKEQTRRGRAGPHKRCTPTPRSAHTFH